MTYYRAKWKALNKIRGSFEQHYGKLRSYITQLKIADKEGIFELKIDLDAKGKIIFKRLHIKFSASRRGFVECCRSIIGFDGAFLKTVLGGAILSSIAKDANNKMYPIAWAVVERENEDTWTWFLQILFEELGVIDGFGWAFISDQQKVHHIND